MRNRVTRMIGFLAATLVFSVATNAFAIDKNQLIQMAKLGLDDKALIASIDSSSADELSLTPEELGELRLQGLSEAVLSHLKSSGRVKGAKKAPEVKDDKGTGDVNLDPAPAPNEDESEEDKKAREAEAKARENEIVKKAEELNQAKDDAVVRDSQLKQATAKLADYKSDVESGDNMKAARGYLEFLSLNPEPTSDAWYAAKFGLAKSLYQQGILSGASRPLLEVLMAGSEKPHFKEAFKMLQVLTRKVGYRPPVLEELTKLYVGDKNDDFKNEFNYYMGKFFFDYNRADLAIKYLSNVEDGSADYPESRYVMGIAQLDESVNDIGGALKNFQGAIVSAEKSKKENQDILQLGYLALARTWYEVGLYDVALFYYQKLPADSSRNAEATFEQAWTYFLKNDHNRALGVFHTLNSPYYSKWYFPDLYVLESTVYLNLCKFEKSQIALAEFKKKYLHKLPRLKKVLTETKEPAAYWTMMMDYKPSEKGLPQLYYNAVLDDLGFFNIYQVVKTLRSEKRALEANISSLGDFGQVVLDNVSGQLKAKIEEGGILVQQRLSGIDRELEDWSLKATQIEFDIDSEEKRQLEKKLLNPDWEPAIAGAGSTFFVVADDWQRWDFEGEYWLDEVPNFRSSLRTECVDQ